MKPIRFKFMHNTILLIFMVILVIQFPILAWWQWGSEGDFDPDYTEPVELLSCKWFNYGNGWVASNPAKFGNWNQHLQVYPLCFQGAISSVLLYYGEHSIAFEESHFNGYLNLGDADGNVNLIQNSRLISIEHDWQYDGIADFTSCEFDDPEQRQLSNSVPGYSSAAHEISRVFAAVKSACNYSYNNGDSYSGWIFNESNKNRLKDIIKNRLGFTNAEFIQNDDPDVKATLIEYLQTKTQPVIAVGNGHTWVLDSYHNYMGDERVHTLDYHSNNGHHTARWDPIADAINYTGFGFIYNLDPVFSVNPVQTREVDYLYGNPYVPNTSNTKREGQFKIYHDDDEAHNFEVTVTSYTWTGSSWGNPVTLVPTTIYSNIQKSYANGILTPSFDYQVPGLPNDALKLVLTISNRSSSVSMNNAYILLEDYMVESKLVKKYSNNEKMNMVERGNIEVEMGQEFEPIVGTGLIYNYGSPLVRLGRDGFLYRPELIEDATAWLEVPGNLISGLVFRDPNGLVTQHIDPMGTVRIAQMVQSPTPEPDPPNCMKLTGPTAHIIRIGTDVAITWDYDLNFCSNAFMFLEISWDSGKRWHLLNTTGGILIEDGSWNWAVPVELDGEPLKDKTIILQSGVYANPSQGDRLDHQIKITE